MSSMTTGTSNQTPVTTQTSVGAMAPSTHARGRTFHETKSAFKTTELLTYLATVVGIIVAAYTIDGGSGSGGRGDYFRADTACLYITIVTVGYLVSRGLAKSGSRDVDHR